MIGWWWNNYLLTYQIEIVAIPIFGFSLFITTKKQNGQNDCSQQFVLIAG